MFAIGTVDAVGAAPGVVCTFLSDEPPPMPGAMLETVTLYQPGGAPCLVLVTSEYCPLLIRPVARVWRAVRRSGRAPWCADP